MRPRSFVQTFFCLMAVAILASFAFAQASSSLLVLSKSDHTVSIVDPSSLQVLARLPSGPDPHEIIASDDGKLAYISNYGGLDSTLNTISVVDLVSRKAMPPIDLGAIRSSHGLAFDGGKLYFTAETNKVIGRYDPATQSVDWILGTGQDRTHMVEVSKSLDKIYTSTSIPPPSASLNRFLRPPEASVRHRAPHPDPDRRPALRHKDRAVQEASRASRGRSRTSRLARALKASTSRPTERKSGQPMRATPPSPSLTSPRRKPFKLFPSP